MSSVRAIRLRLGLRWRGGLVQALLACAAGAVVAQLALSATTGDYQVSGAVAGDNAAPAIDALVHGHIGSFVSHQPLMGLTSIVIRAPFAALASLMGAGNQLIYRVGALACLLPVALLCAWMVSRRGASRSQRIAGALAAVAVLLGPATAQTVNVGHPEEALAAALATGAVLVAIRGRSTWAAILLGLAVATKQWALLATPCVLLALPNGRLAATAKAGAVALALSAALPLADPAAFAHVGAGVGGFNFSDPFSLWWPLGGPLQALPHATFVPTAHQLPLGLTRSAAAGGALLIALGGLWLYGLRIGGWRRYVDPLALLALVGLVRCIGDPTPLQYNFVAVLIPLAAWEAVGLGRLPLVTALATATVALISRGVTAFNAGGAPGLAPSVVSALSIAWTLTLAGYLAFRVFHSTPDTNPFRLPSFAVGRASEQT